MNTLYELTGQYLELLEMLENDDGTEEQVIRDTLEGIDGELEIKADNYAEIIPELGKEAGMPRTWTDLKITLTASRFMSHGMEYAAKLYSEETNEGSGQGMGAGVEL